MEHLRALYQDNGVKRLLLAGWILLTLTTFATLSFAIQSRADASASRPSSKCKTSRNIINISGTTATATFDVPRGCPGTHVLLASYTAPNGTDGKPYSEQKLYSSNRAKFGPGRHQISIKIPNCYYQVDLARGTVLQNFRSTTYTQSPSHVLMAARHGGNQSCGPVTPPPVQPPVTPQPPVIIQQQQSQSQSTVVNNNITTASAKQSDEYVQSGTALPETGASAGTIVATFFGVTSISSVLYKIAISRLFV